MSEQKTSAWSCCQCKTNNFNVDICFICGHPICDTCTILTDEETNKIMIGTERAEGWLMGQEQVKKTWNEKAYETTKRKEEEEEFHRKVRTEEDSRIEKRGKKR